MSLKTWKAEFYPVDADKVSKADALAHSLRKWEGLRAENLERHGLATVYYAEIRSCHGGRLRVNNTTCALCNVHDDNCELCPLYYRKRNCYSRERSPYNAFAYHHDPEPMIALIKSAMERAKGGGK